MTEGSASAKEVQSLGIYCCLYPKSLLAASSSNKRRPGYIYSGTTSCPILTTWEGEK